MLPFLRRRGAESILSRYRVCGSPITGTAGLGFDVRASSAGSSALELLPPARVASQLAAAVTAVMSEWEDYDFKRENKQEEQVTSFSRHKGCPNVQVMLLIKERSRHWQRSRCCSLPGAEVTSPTAPALGKDHPVLGPPSIPRDAQPVSGHGFTLDLTTSSSRRVSGSGEHPETPN